MSTLRALDDAEHDGRGLRHLQESRILDGYPPASANGTYTFLPFFVAKFQGCSGPNGEGCDQVIYHSFNITASPGSIQTTAATDYVTVVYTITAPSNSTGFYDQSAPWWGQCATMPMAVGYSAYQVNASDFNQGPPDEGCFGSFSAVAVYTTGMNVTYISLPP